MSKFDRFSIGRGDFPFISMRLQLPLHLVEIRHPNRLLTRAAQLDDSPLASGWEPTFWRRLLTPAAQLDDSPLAFSLGADVPAPLANARGSVG
jgi:hypothetical protein